MDVKFFPKMSIRDLMNRFPDNLDTPIFLYVFDVDGPYVPLGACNVYRDNLCDIVDQEVVTISVNKCWKPD
jgi:hypothetical protein